MPSFLYWRCDHQQFLASHFLFLIFRSTALILCIDSSSFGDFPLHLHSLLDATEFQLVAAAQDGRADDVVELIGQGADIEFRDEVRHMQCVVEDFHCFSFGWKSANAGLLLLI